MERRLRRTRRDGKNARRPVNSWKTAGPTAGSSGHAQTKRDLKMNGKKYELTDKTKILADGTVLRRIRAVRKFTIHDEIMVRNGDLGGDGSNGRTIFRTTARHGSTARLMSTERPASS